MKSLLYHSREIRDRNNQIVHSLAWLMFFTIFLKIYKLIVAKIWIFYVISKSARKKEKRRGIIF